MRRFSGQRIYSRWLCRLSTVVVQRFCKPKVGGSNPSAGTKQPFLRPGHMGNALYLKHGCRRGNTKALSRHDTLTLLFGCKFPYPVLQARGCRMPAILHACPV